MKKSDIALVILIAALSVMIAFVIASNIPILQQSKDSTKARTIEKITSSVTDPDARVFNQDAINPTVETVIGGGAGGSARAITQNNTDSTTNANTSAQEDIQD